MNPGEFWQVNNSGITFATYYIYRWNKHDRKYEYHFDRGNIVFYASEAEALLVCDQLNVRDCGCCEPELQARL